MLGAGGESGTAVWYRPPVPGGPEERSARASWGLPAGVGVMMTALAAMMMLRSPDPWALRLDNRLVIFPLTLSAWKSWLAAQWPVWTDGIWAGFPLLTEPQTAALYLPHALAFALTPAPHWRAFDLATAAHIGLMAAGMTAFLRALDARPTAAIAGGVLAALSSEFMNWTFGFLPCTVALSWWPWGLLAADRLAWTDRPARWVLLGGIAIAAGFLGGYPEFGIDGAALDCMWLLLRTDARPFYIRLGRVAVLAVVAAGLAAPQMLPSGLEIADTLRSGRPDNADWIPICLGGVRDLFDPFRVAPGFLGLLTCVTALLGARSAAGRRLWIVVALSFTIALGTTTPVYGWLSSVRPFYWFRNPSKFSVVTQLALAALAGLGIDTLLRASAQRSGLAMLAALLALGATSERLTAGTYTQQALANAAEPDKPLTSQIELVTRGILPALPARASNEPPPRVWVRARPAFIGGLPMVWGVEQLGGSKGSLVGRRNWTAFDAPMNAARAQLLGVEAMLWVGRPCSPLTGWDEALDGPGGCFYRNRTPPRRYEIIARSQPVASETALVAAVDGATQPDLVPVLAGTNDLPTTGAGNIVVLEHREGHATLRVTTSEPSLLLVRESWKPGWTARVDDTSTPIYQAAGVYFAVPLPAGAHDVRLAFRQPGLALGLAAALSVLGLLSIQMVREGRRGAAA